jgi:heme exporter protein D
MIWHNWSDFIAMGGYGRYVWGSLLVVAASVAAELLALRKRRNLILAELSLAKRLLRNGGAGTDEGSQ